MLLKLFMEAIRLLKGYSKYSRYGVIQEVLITFKQLLNQLKALKERLKDVNYNDPKAPKDYLILNINLAYIKLIKYYTKFNNTPIYYTTTILYLYYKYYLEALQKVLDNYNSVQDRLYYRDSQFTSNYYAFLAIQKDRKDAAIIAKGAITARLSKKLRISLLVLRLAFLQSLIDATIKQVEINLKDKYEVQKRQPTLDEDDPLALNPVQYQQLQAQ